MLAAVDRLVGRTAEREQIDRVLRQQPARGVVLTGAPGVGKTRLAEECLATLAAGGVPTATVRATRAGASVPFGALAPVLPSTLGPVDRRVDLLRQVIEALEGLAVDGGGVLWVDDAHLVDDAGAAALHAIAGRGLLSLLLTVRSEVPVSDAIVGLWKDGLADRIDLGPLTATETADLAAAQLGGALDGASAQDLWNASQGNPLFVRELIQGAREAGTLREQGGIWRFTARPATSPRLRELITARLADLSRAEWEVVELLSVGGELGLDMLVDLVDPSVLASLERHRLLEVGSDGRRRPVRLVHPLYTEHVRSNLGPISSVAVYRRLADALETTGARRRGDLVHLALWRLEGSGAVRPDLMVDAARQAVFAWDEQLALRLAEAARKAGAGLDADLLQAQALLQLGRFTDAADTLAHATESATTDEEIVATASELSVTLFWALGREQDALDVLEAAELRAETPPARALLECQIVTYEALAGRPESAITRIGPHLDGDAGHVYVAAAVAASPGLTVMGRAGDALAVAETALDALSRGVQPPGPFTAFTLMMARAFALGELGRLADADAASRAAYELAIEQRAVPGQAWSAMLMGRSALLAGRMADAAAGFAEGAALFDELSETGLRRWCLAGQVLAAAMTGDAAGARRSLAELDASPDTAIRLLEAEVERARAWASWADGRQAAAVSTLADAAARAEASGAYGMALGLAHELARLGEANAALGFVERAGDRVDGELAAARASFVTATADNDAAGLTAVADRFARIGALLFAAEAAAKAGEDASARAWTAACQGALTPALAWEARPRLSGRQREVAALAAEGHTSRVIAEHLGLSVRTVENHLHQVYEKLGVSRRADLREVLRVDDR